MLTRSLYALTFGVEYDARTKEYDARTKEYDARTKEYDARTKEYDGSEFSNYPII